jgi:hypothetical protein
VRKCTSCTQPDFNSIISWSYLDKLGERQIFYCNIRSDKNWYDKIYFDNWVAFTIADEEDKNLLHDMTVQCIDKGVCYACSAGQSASLTEDYFDEEIVWRQVQREQTTGKQQDYESTPMTSFHKNFDEGFWFAATNARQTINDNYVTSEQVVCIDCTTRKVRGHLIALIEMINSNWLPSGNEIKAPTYDIQ